MRLPLVLKPRHLHTLAALLVVGTLLSCAPTLISASAAERITQREEEFLSSGRSITVDHYSPGTPGTHPAVIVLHGSGGIHLFFGRTIQSYAEAMAAEGFESYVVHYYDGTDTFVADDAEEREKYFDWVRVIADAVDWVGKRPGVRPGHVSVMGQSLGGFLAVGVAAADPRVAAAVVISGGLEPFLPDSITRMPPTLILHGDADRTVPVGEARTLASFLRAHHVPHQLHIYPGEDHQFSDSVAVDAIRRSAQFLRRKRAGRGELFGVPVTGQRVGKRRIFGIPID